MLISLHKYMTHNIVCTRYLTVEFTKLMFKHFYDIIYLVSNNTYLFISLDIYMHDV